MEDLTRLDIQSEIEWAAREASYGGPRDPMARVYLGKYRTLLQQIKLILRENELKLEQNYVGKHRNEAKNDNFG